MHRVHTLTVFFSIQCFMFVNGQQNSTLFLMQSTPQANFVNPAVRNDCSWIIGLPVLSSVHAELGNPSFTIHQILKKQPDNSYLFDGNDVMKRLTRTNYLDAQAHVNLLFVGFWRKKDYITFSVNEKADLFVTFPRDLFALAWNGNTQFVGKTANLGRTALFLNYRREYAVGIARQPARDFIWGVRAKLLFGKLNTAFTRSNVNLYTDPVTYDWNFSSRLNANTSIPINVILNGEHNINTIQYNGNIKSILLNRNNVGLAFDLGFINYRNDKVTVSGSLLDLGLIRWASNAYNFKDNGNFLYSGPLNDTIQRVNYVDHMIIFLKDDFGIKAKPSAYLDFLIPTYYLGTTYNLAKDLNAGAVLSGRINRFRITSGLTLSLNKTFKQKMSVSLSYSYLYRSLKNLGLGIKLGKSPVQFYAVSDNILGFIKPLDTKNINLRTGLQFNFGCSHRSKLDNYGCSWLREEEDRKERINHLLQKL